MKVELSQSFIKGNSNTEYFKDIPFMNDNELKTLYDFMRNIEQGMPLRGKNKPSWLDDNSLEDLPNTEIYKQNNCWHYHCGPYAKSKKFYAVRQLKLNINGETSSAVIHYQKITDTHIFIIAYSPIHIPFPNVFMRPNPLIDRAK